MKIERTLVVAGASGYIGKEVLPRLLQRFPDARIIAIARSERPSEDPRVEWRACDLFSLKSLEAAIPPKVDLALYLVHSMGPTAQLDQGSFADYDLILADNFARAVSKAGVRHVIYLGGLIPDARTLSLHLQSRLEVEETFSQYDLPLTVFRAGLILGERGSSFQILLKLVNRLPVMICPRWTQSMTTPVDLETVLSAITAAALQPEHIGKVYDLAACKPLSYMQMMKETARYLGKKRLFFTVPFFTPTLSRLWVTLITQTPRALVYPLIESLEHPMVAREPHLFPGKGASLDYFALLGGVSTRIQPGASPFGFRAQRKTVRSVQRLPLPPGKDALWVKDHFVEWLPRFLAPLVRVRSEAQSLRFCVISARLVMLELEPSEERSHPDRQLLYIKRGLLVARGKQGRLELRVVLRRKFVLAALHDYKPSLPWFVYKYTQAVLHLFVMKAFGKELMAGGRATLQNPAP